MADTEYANRYEVPPEGYLRLEVLMEVLDLGDLGDQCVNYDDQEIFERIFKVAKKNAAKEQDKFPKAGIYRMAETMAFDRYTDDLYEHRGDIAKYVTLDALKGQGLYAVSQELADMLSDGINWESEKRFDTLVAKAKDLIDRALADAMEAATDGNVHECGYDEVNPCAMSTSAIRTVNEKGFEAAFAEQWEGLLPDDGEGRNAGEAPSSLKETARACRATSEALDNDRGGRAGRGHEGR